MSKCLELLTEERSMPGKSLRDVALGQLAGCEMGLTLESEEGEVPHLRWSQAPPLPWPRPGSADYLFPAYMRGSFFCWESAALRASSASRCLLRLSINLSLSQEKSINTSL
jgi:hypothetical protein